VIVFVVLVVTLRLWQYRQRRSIKVETAIVDQRIHDAAEVAQRRHVQRFGRASTDLTDTMNGTGHRVVSKS
jgi:hypothetical protein